MVNRLEILRAKVLENAEALKLESERFARLEEIGELINSFARVDMCSVENREVRVTPYLLYVDGKIVLLATPPHKYDSSGYKWEYKEPLTIMAENREAIKEIAKTNISIDKFEKFIVNVALPKFINGEDKIAFDYIVPLAIRKKIRERRY